MELEEHAVVKIRAQMEPQALRDICFGGYCAELTLYERKRLKADVPIYVNADRAANDCISLVTRINPSDASVILQRLDSGGLLVGGAVRDLFNRYGRDTYDKMYNSRGALFKLADEIFEFWEDRQFARCEWTASNS